MEGSEARNGVRRVWSSLPGSKTPAAGIRAGVPVRIIAVGGWLMTSVFSGVGLFLLAQNGSSFVPSHAVALFFPTLGTLIVWQRPSNPIGWIFGVAGLAGSMTLFASQYAEYGSMLPHDPLVGVAAAGWFGSWLWVPAVGLAGTAFVLFPDGRLPSRRWWPVLAMIAAGLAAVASGMALRPWHASVAGLYDGSFIGIAVRATPFEALPQHGQNPFASGGSLAVSDRLLGAGVTLMLVGWFGAIAALFVRYQRGSHTHRQQLKILVFVVAFLPVIHLATIRGGGVSSTVTAINVVLLATAVTVAMLRHHLFDIDTVIRRTVTYTAVTVLLAGVFSLSVITLAPLVQLLTGGRESDLVVAASTLAVAALFNPLRRRTHLLVSRHFQRTPYDSSLILEAFSQRLRLVGDLDLFAGELRSTVASTMQPVALSLWAPSAPQHGPPIGQSVEGAPRWLSTTS